MDNHKVKDKDNKANKELVRPGLEQGLLEKVRVLEQPDQEKVRELVQSGLEQGQLEQELGL